MVKFLSSNQITASHYHRKDHRVCKINVVNRISSLESAARRVALSNFDINVQCAIHNIWRSRLLANSRMLKVPTIVFRLENTQNSAFYIYV